MAILKFIIHLPAILLFVLSQIFMVAFSKKYRGYFLNDYSKRLSREPQIIEETVNKISYVVYITFAAILLILKFKN